MNQRNWRHSRLTNDNEFAQSGCFGSRTRENARNDLPALATINAKVRICGKQDRTIQGFRHSDKRSVREAGRHVRIFRHQSQNRFEISGEIEGWNYGASPKQSTQR